MTIPYSFGPRIGPDGLLFRLWAPSAETADLEIEGGLPRRMTALADGWKEIAAPGGPGTRYRFRIGETLVPDPASRGQAGGVHGWSVVHAQHEPSTGWKGRPWNETVLYEIHPGLAGGFAGISKRLEGLRELGITAIEMMPIAAFPGERNWGYDGVLPFAPAEAYGTPDDLRALVARAHELDLMVFLDVVYNHFGPDGNYLALYAKSFFREDQPTPWGAALDFRKPEVRRFFTENALYWVTEFDLDGLRFDAVHAIRDNGWLDEVAQELRAGLPADRHLHLVLENEDNEASHLRHGFDAQWNDDFHNVLHVLLTGETSSYYGDFADTPAAKLARALSEGFTFQGEPFATREGKPRGSPSADLGPSSFVSFLQNHDQIGNRPFGDRLTLLARPGALRAATALLLLCPQIPLLFMGDEIGSRAPFLFFTDHGTELAKAVREGRNREFAAFLASVGEKELPNPNTLDTFKRSMPESDAPEAEEWRTLYRTLLALRRDQIVPYIPQARSLGAKAIGPKAVIARWSLGEERELTIACNLDDLPVVATLPMATPIWGDPPEGSLGSDTTLVWLEP